MIKECDYCKKEFYAKSKKHRFCCAECSKKHYLNLRDQTAHHKNRYLIFARDFFTCVYCGRKSYKDNIKLHLEHIYPVDKGGSDKIFNLVTACEQCNLEKSASLLPDEVIIELWNIIEQRNKTRLKTRTCHELEKYFMNYSNAYRKI